MWTRRPHLPLAFLLPSLVSAATPLARWGHTSVLLPSSDSVLFIGGQLASSSSSSLSITASVQSLSLPSGDLHDLSSSADLPAHAWASAALGSDDKVWLIGGATADCSGSDIRIFDGQKWTEGEASGSPPRRRQASAVAVGGSTSARIFNFGGVADEYSCSTSGTVGYVGLDVYETSSATVTTSSISTSSNPPLSNYAALLLPDGKSIAYIGGSHVDGSLSDLSTVRIYDTSALAWTTQATTGTAPSARIGHTAILLPSNNRILVFGGQASSSASAATLAEMYMLDTHTWEWLALTVADTPARSWHTAVLAPDDKTMIVGFGLESPGTPSAAILYYDTSAQTWSTSYTSVTSSSSSAAAESTSAAGQTVAPTGVDRSTHTAYFTPSSLRVAYSVTSTASPASSSSSNRTASIAGGVTAVVVIGALVACGAFLYRRACRHARDSQQQRFTAFPSRSYGNNNDDSVPPPSRLSRLAALLPGRPRAGWAEVHGSDAGDAAEKGSITSSSSSHMTEKASRVSFIPPPHRLRASAHRGSAPFFPLETPDSFFPVVLPDSATDAASVRSYPFLEPYAQAPSSRSGSPSPAPSLEQEPMLEADPKRTAAVFVDECEDFADNNDEWSAGDDGLLVPEPEPSFRRSRLPSLKSSFTPLAIDFPPSSPLPPAPFSAHEQPVARRPLPTPPAPAPAPAPLQLEDVPLDSPVPPAAPFAGPPPRPASPAGPRPFVPWAHNASSP